jgi:D-arginine dehydrogenase
LSPADETLVKPMDAYSETLDVATAIDRVGPVLDMEISRVTHEWAGLRSFVADKSPVIGFDQGIENFFWLAAQGGYGIQTAPALAQFSAGMIQGECIPERLLELGFSPDSVEPARYQ